MFRRSIFLILVICLLVSIEGCRRKIERVEIRYRYTRGRVDNLTSQELELERILKEAARFEAAIKYARGMFDLVYIIAAEHPDLGFTVFFKDDRLVVERGLDISKEPDLVIPLSDEGVFNVKQFFEDGVIDEREEFLIVNATFKPAWEASYRMPEIRSRWIRKFMELEGLMHVVLLNPNNYEYKGKVVKNELSVVYVSNQWLVFNGLEGVADRRMELTVEDAKAMYKLIMRDLKLAKSLFEKIEIMNKFKKIRDRCLTKR